MIPEAEIGIEVIIKSDIPKGLKTIQKNISFYK